MDFDIQKVINATKEFATNNKYIWETNKEKDNIYANMPIFPLVENMRTSVRFIKHAAVFVNGNDNDHNYPTNSILICVDGPNCKFYSTKRGDKGNCLTSTKHLIRPATKKEIMESINV